MIGHLFWGRHQPFFVAFAKHFQVALVQMGVFDSESAEFRNPQSAVEHGSDDGEVAGAERIIGIEDVNEPVDLLVGEHLNHLLLVRGGRRLFRTLVSVKPSS